MNVMTEGQNGVKELAMIYEFGGAACATGATISIKCLVRSAD